MIYNKRLMIVVLILLMLLTGCNERDQRLIVSAKVGNLDTLNLLLEKGAHVNVRDNEERTPLMYAAQNGHLDVVKKLISSGAEISLKDIYGENALSLALKSEKLKTVSYLVENGADIISEINSRYYNLNNLGLRGFKFQITSSMLEEVKQMINSGNLQDESILEIVNNIKFQAVLKDEQFYVSNSEYPSTGNQQLDQGLDQIVVGIRQAINGFYNTWQGFVINPIFLEKDFKYHFEAHQDGYKIVFNEGLASFTMLLDKNLKIKKFTSIFVEDVIKIFPKFVDTEHGFLLKSYSGEFNNGNMELSIDIEYQEIKDLKLPKGISSWVEFMGERNFVQFEFSNHEVNKGK